MCPNCRGERSKSTLIDETPFREAADDARMLRALGELGAAAEVLTKLAAVRIENFLRLNRACLGCGAHFDG